MKRTIPLAALERLLKSSGAERVSDKAKLELKTHLEEYAIAISAEAAKMAMHAGRKTVKTADIKMASK